MSEGLYLPAFHKAKTILRRAGFRPAFEALKREVTRRKLARAINRSRIFAVGSVSVPHINNAKAVVVVRVNSLNGTGTSLRITGDGYAVNGRPVTTDSPHYGRMAALERVVLQQEPHFGKPVAQFKLANGL